MTAKAMVLTFLLNSIWEVTLIFCAAQMGSWTLRTAPARFRHRLWAAAGALAILLPAMSSLPVIGHDYSLGIFDADILEERVMKLLRNQTLSVFWSRIALALVLIGLTSVCIRASAYAVRIGDGTANPAPGAQDEAAKLDAGVTPPRAVSTPDPIYPKTAKKEGRQGDVRLWCVIGTDGSVREAGIAKSLSQDFDESAINAVRQWTFEPATKNGQPVEVKVSVEVSFKLYNK